MPPPGAAAVRVNLGGEGEIPGVINQQEPAVLKPSWYSSVTGKSFQDLVNEGHQFVIAPNTQLPFADDSVDEVITNSVPIDQVTYRGPGVQTSEIKRILKPGGRWINNGQEAYVKP